MKKLFTLVTILLFLASCSSKVQEDLKSPCVGLEDSPCGPRKPVNTWLL